MWASSQGREDTVKVLLEVFDIINNLFYFWKKQILLKVVGVAVIVL